jgi:hypothetical protein
MTRSQSSMNAENRSMMGQTILDMFDSGQRYFPSGNNPLWNFLVAEHRAVPSRSTGALAEKRATPPGVINSLAALALIRIAQSPGRFLPAQVVPRFGTNLLIYAFLNWCRGPPWHSRPSAYRHQLLPRAGGRFF